MAMKIIQGLFEKLIITILFAVIIHFFNSFVPFLSLLPQLSIHAGSKLLIGPKYSSFILLALGLYLILSTILSSRLVWNRKLSRICPQFSFFSKIAVFSSNGFASYAYKKEGEITFLEVMLQNFVTGRDDKDGFTTFSDCGIIFLKEMGCWPFSKGYKISNKKGISFEIMGKNGGENLGLSFKNLHGHEQKLPINQLIEGQLEKDTWKKVNIDLDKFTNVTGSIRDKSYIECFTFFTNSKLSQDKRVIFYLRGIRFS